MRDILVENAAPASASNVLKRQQITPGRIIAGSIAGAVAFFCLCFLVFGRVTEKTFSDKGISITLTSAFHEAELHEEELAKGELPFLLCYDSYKTTVYVTREAFADYEPLETFSLDRYTRLRISSAEWVDGAALEHTASGIPYFEFEENGTSGQLKQIIRCYTYRSDDAFWLVEFLADASDAASLRPQFDAWAETVAFP